MKEAILGGLRCWTREPKDFDPQRRYPVLLVLHGAGSRGDMENLKNNPFFQANPVNGVEQFYCVAPLCTENTWFDHWEHLLALVKELAALPYADPDRLCLLGASMGGYATWQLGMSLPEYVAAMVPICGGGMYWNARRLSGIPIWAFHGAKDPTVFVEESVKMVEGVNRRDGNAKLTIYPENGHDAWSDTYKNPEVFAWLLQQRKGRCQEGENEYNDPKRFG